MVAYNRNPSNVEQDANVILDQFDQADRQLSAWKDVHLGEYDYVFTNVALNALGYVMEYVLQPRWNIDTP